MRKVMLGTLLLVAASLVGMGVIGNPAPLQAKENVITLKFSHGYPVGTKENPYFIHKLALLFQQYADEYTEWRIKTTIFPASQLFKAKEEIEGCRRGDVDIISTPSQYAAKYNKLERIRFFPVIVSWKGVSKWATNPQVYEMNRKVYEDKIGKLKFLGYIPTPVYKMLWTKKPIAKIEDF